jgi:hypothetical protein
VLYRIYYNLINEKGGRRYRVNPQIARSDWRESYSFQFEKQE